MKMNKLQIHRILFLLATTFAISLCVVLAGGPIRESELSPGDSEDPADFNLKENTQVGTANIAIATCNIVGLMPGNSVQRDFLSQAYSDFIFAIIIEELGLWGASLVVFFYIVLIFRAWRIGSQCKTLFPAFLIMGLAFMLTSQAVINMMVAVGLFPVTGQPLPLISRGGTAMIIFCFYFGMMLSVSISAKQKEEIPAES
jgi:cell division protein FtsW